MRMKMNIRGQFKIQQMTFMISAVFIFFIIAGIFVVSIQVKNLRSTAQVLEQNKAIGMAQNIVDSPEFSCTGKSYCIDTDKLMVLMNRTAYKGFWPVAYIRVQKVYPFPMQQADCTAGNYPNCSSYRVYDSGVQGTGSTGSYVALCRKERIEERAVDKCEIGKIIIGYKLTQNV